MMTLTRPLLSAVVLLLCAGVAAAQPVQRRAGLWSMTMEGMPSGMRQCIGDRGDDLATSRPPELMGHQCEPPTIVRESAQRVVVTGQCTDGGRATSTRMVFTGDFERAFDAEITVHREAAATSRRQRTMRASYRWEGPCPAGMQPGQIQMPGGRTFTPGAQPASR